MSSSQRIRAHRWPADISFRACLLIGAGFIALQALALLAMGHPLICTCGTIKLWHGGISSPENSQHLTDWYTYSHVIHGFGFYLLLWFIAPRMPLGLRFAIAIGLEAGWEIVENAPLIMDRYRQSALAQGYFGDSVVNSVVDTLAAALGLVLARILPVWIIVALVIGLELFAVYTIRDNLTLNIIQLIRPSESISQWQMGGQ
ncbi:MAG: DUF2585 family protein [Xanthobacteraceae bacterium]